MRRLADIPVAALPIERFREVLDAEAYAALLDLRARAAGGLSGRVVWCVNSTARGGGVAEMLRSLLGYARGAGIDARWSVVAGDAPLFAITKRLHNRLHGAAGDGGPLGPGERAHYEAVTGAAAAELVARARPGDVVILHDPQTAGMAPLLRAAGLQVLWRLHVGADAANEHVDEAVRFLEPYVASAAVCIFSRRQFVWPRLEPARTAVIAPSIDAFSPKNQELPPAAVEAILARAAIHSGKPRTPPRYRREDGEPATVHRHAALVQERPLTPGDRYVAQVSRWDRLKDPAGVLTGFARNAEAWHGAHLLLAGPASMAVADDPEGLAVLMEVGAARAALPRALRERVHLATLPMEDADENAAIVNAIQRRAAVVVQKSLAEGFGLTVTEAMWKARPLVVSRVGGIKDQIDDGVEGLCVDPEDFDGFGRAVARLLREPALAARLGAAAQARVRADFLAPRHLEQWLEVVAAVLDAGQRAA